MFGDSRTFSRTLAGSGLVVGPLLWILSMALSPAWADDAAGYLAEVAAAPNRHVLSGGLFLVGSIVALPGLVGTARLLRGRRVTVGQVGAYLLAIGALNAGGFTLVLNTMEAAMVDEAANRAEMIALSDRGEESITALIGFVGMFLVGFVGGLLLLAIGLFARRAVTVWSPALIVAGIVAMFVLGESRWGSVAGMAVLLAGLVPIAARILSLSDEEWERWEPLPTRGRSKVGTEEELGRATVA
jgi:hypothetical protein